jgi:hypothetical protein
MGKTKRNIDRERNLPAAHDTVRQSIIQAIEEDGLLSANDISGMVGIPEKRGRQPLGAHPDIAP